MESAVVDMVRVMTIHDARKQGVLASAELLIIFQSSALDSALGAEPILA